MNFPNDLVEIVKDVVGFTIPEPQSQEVFRRLQAKGWSISQPKDEDDLLSADPEEQ